MSLSTSLCYVIIISAVFAHITDAVDVLDYDPIISLRYSDPLIVSSDVAAATRIQTAPTTINWLQNSFGGNVLSATGRSSETFRVVVSTPLLACTDLDHPWIVNASQQQIRAYYAGTIVLSMRGTCGVPVKAAMAERVGAVLHITTMLSDIPVRTMFLGAAPTPSDPMQIASGTVDWAPGFTLIQSMLANPNITVNGTVATTGPAHPVDIAAITAVIRSLSYVDVYGAGPGSDHAGSYELYPFLNDSTVYDPCLNRMIWSACVGGRITYLLWYEMGFSGPFSPAWGRLTGLEFLSLSGNALQGPMPCEWGALANLKALHLDQTGLTSWTHCTTGMTQLEWIRAGFSDLSNLPPELGHLHHLKALSFASAKIAAPMIDIRNWTRLEFLELSANNITGPIPNLQSARNSLTHVYMTDCKLSGSIPVSLLDDMPQLLRVDISRNQLTGKLPNFNNTQGLLDLGFSHNGFTGSIPWTWHMPQLKSLRGAHNQLEGSVTPLSSFTSLASLDLSWNRLYTPYEVNMDKFSGVRTFTDVVTYFASALPLGLRVMQLSHNQYNGTFGKLEVDKFYQANLTQIYLSHNNLSYMTERIFKLFDASVVKESPLQVLDLSFNPYMIGTMTPIGPSATLQQLKLHGCPLLRDTFSTPPALPAFLQPSTDQLTKNSATDRYLCPAIEGKHYPMQFSIDPSYYGYTGCECDHGTYGTPPYCRIIPISSQMSDPLHGLITDSVYGVSRMSIGIDTSWAVGGFLEGLVISNRTTPINNDGENLVNSSSINNNTIVTRTVGGGGSDDAAPYSRAIYITINFEASFSHHADILDIYRGRDTRGLPMVSVRGSESRPFVSNEPDAVQLMGFPQATHDIHTNTSLTTYVIFAPYATLNFRSRKSAGQHFVANYSVMSSCPPGWKQVSLLISIEGEGSTSLTCERIRPVYSLPESVSSFVYAVTAVVLLLVFIASLLLVRYRNTVVFRAASVLFCACILLFAAMLSVGSVLYVISPDTHPSVCSARLWLSTLSLVGLLGSLLTKANRIRNIFAGRDLTSLKQAGKTTVALKTLLLMLSIEMILLIIVSAANLSHEQLLVGDKATSGYNVYACTSVENRSYKIWLAIQLTYIGTFLFFGLYIAFAIRNVPTAFNESSHIVLSLYVLTLLSIILLPLNFIVDDNPAALAIIRGLGQNLVSISMTVAIFASKFYFIFEGRGNDKSTINTNVINTRYSAASHETREGENQKLKEGQKHSEDCRPPKPTNSNKLSQLEAQPIIGDHHHHHHHHTASVSTLSHTSGSGATGVLDVPGAVNIAARSHGNVEDI